MAAAPAKPAHAAIPETDEVIEPSDEPDGDPERAT